MINLIYVNKFIYKKLIEYYGLGMLLLTCLALCFHELTPRCLTPFLLYFQNDFKSSHEVKIEANRKRLRDYQFLQVSHNLQTSFCFLCIYSYRFRLVLFKMLTVLTGIVFY